MNYFKNMQKILIKKLDKRKIFSYKKIYNKKNQFYNSAVAVGTTKSESNLNDYLDTYTSDKTIPHYLKPPGQI